MPGTQFLRDDGNPVPNNLLTTPDGKVGLEADYSEWHGLDLGSEVKPTILTSRVELNVDLSESSLPSEAAGKKSVGVQWTGFLTPPDSGEYLVGIRASAFAKLALEGKPVAQEFRTHGAEAKLGRVHLQKGQKVALNVSYGTTGEKEPLAQLTHCDSLIVVRDSS